MGKSDEPTLIQIDKGTSSAKKKNTTKSTNVTRKVNKREAERISDAADALVLDDVKPAKKPVKNSTKVAAKGSRTSPKAVVKAGAKPLVVDGMVRQKTSPKAKPKPVDTKGDLDVKADRLSLKEPEMIDENVKQPEGDEAKIKSGIKRTRQFSKPKATIIAIAVAALVGVVGMLLMFALNRSDEKMCTVKFDVNGGSAVEDQVVVCGTKASRPDDPEREGFEFQDWLVDGMPFDFEEETVDQDIVVLAKWLVGRDTEVVTVTFDSAGGSEVTEREVMKGKPVTPPLDPTRDGYTFDGWYLDGEKFDFETPIEEDITLVAGWKNNATGEKVVPQAKGSDDQKLTMFEVTGNWSSVIGDPIDIDVRANPVTVKVDLEIISNSSKNIECHVVSSRKINCSSVVADEATIEIRDKISGRSATFKVTFTAKNNNNGTGTGAGSGTGTGGNNGGTGGSGTGSGTGSGSGNGTGTGGSNDGTGGENGDGDGDGGGTGTGGDNGGSGTGGDTGNGDDE